ncbi:hypothetical protein F7725_024705 [Dissostichus mawsoni]|uniref:Endonuclease/exonuclease/phosphatase family domain-containing protein 1 n=1 Tax=Dissostichus mawsoni TaxID=36200 RepID=A0A7J5X9C0_DISMA|nr:hypothetical protein F7725_024705 [Dissostichus mawsoni]
MGGSLGCHRSIPRDPTDFSCGKRKFSAACNFGPVLVNQERLNINTATEEELMTLPGVNRAVAQNITEYRDCIGGLESGIGATKLEIIKLEICVSSRTSSSQHSPSSVRKDAEHTPGSGININTATPAQLQSLRGITERIAGNIAAYRGEHGPFRSIEDLVRVKNINSSLLDRIRFQVFVERSRAPSTSRSHPSPTSFSSEEMDPGGPAHMLSSRPDMEPLSGLRDGKPVVRIGTWSLQSCCCDKANNPGVKEVVCMTLLENDVKLLAVQDLTEREALDKFCLELNQGTLPSVRKWKRPRGLWKSLGVSFSGFLWDSSSGIELRDAAILESPVGSYDLTLLNVHLQSVASSESNGGIITSRTQRVSPRPAGHTQRREGAGGSGRFWLLPPLTAGGPEEGEALPPAELLHLHEHQHLLPSGSGCLDNIWLSRSLRKIYSGHFLVVREGLTNPWIPDNWSWGGVASDHCPLFPQRTESTEHRGARHRAQTREVRKRRRKKKTLRGRGEDD